MHDLCALAALITSPGAPAATTAAAAAPLALPGVHVFLLTPLPTPLPVPCSDVALIEYIRTLDEAQAPADRFVIRGDLGDQALFVKVQSPTCCYLRGVLLLKPLT